MTIHSEHPFLPAEPERNPVRRLRGRLSSPVTLWTAGGSTHGATSSTDGATGAVPRAGLTVSSLLVADGDPGYVVGVIDPLSDLWDAIQASGSAVVTILDWRHRQLADQFGYVAPAPGGPFAAAEWEQSSFGPVLTGDPAPDWAGCQLTEQEPRQLGWGLLVSLTIVEVQLSTAPEPGDDAQLAPLIHRRGQYLRTGG